MKTTKDDPCACELRAFLSERLLRTRDELKLTQLEFASELNIDRRSYIDLEHRKNMCCAVTLLTYLCYQCKNPLEVLDGCRKIMDKYRMKAD